MAALLVVAAALVGQGRGVGSFEFRNGTGDQVVTIWIYSLTDRGWANRGKPLVVKPHLATRLNLYSGRYRLVFKSSNQSSLTQDRTLAGGESDRLQIGDPQAGMMAAAQLQVFSVRGDSGDYEEAIAPPMVAPSP